MKVIIIGCGRLGSGLANRLSKEGNEVTVIDTNPEAFLELAQEAGYQVIAPAREVDRADSNTNS